MRTGSAPALGQAGKGMGERLGPEEGPARQAGGCRRMLCRNFHVHASAAMVWSTLLPCARSRSWRWCPPTGPGRCRAHSSGQGRKGRQEGTLVWGWAAPPNDTALQLPLLPCPSADSPLCHWHGLAQDRPPAATVCAPPPSSWRKPSPATCRRPRLPNSDQGAQGLRSRAVHSGV